jgi:hypothetical protein
MTTEEKRKALDAMCESYMNCSDGCPLYIDSECPLIRHDTDEDIEIIYSNAFPSTPTNTPTITPTNTVNTPTEPIIEDSGDEPTSVEQHMKIVVELNQLYEKKNKDYGDSFHTSFIEEGMAMARIRLGDKLSRFKTLTKNNQQEVKDESIRDTLIDLANYAIMTVMEIDRKD